MERVDTLQKLRSGQLPESFSERIGEHSGHLAGYIMDSLSCNEDITVASLKERLSAVQAMFAERL